MELMDDYRDGHGHRGARLSRRAFVGLAAATALAGCAPVASRGSGPSGTSVATRAPAPRAPRGHITAANASALRRLAMYSPDAGMARGAAWSRDGRRLAAGCDESVVLWDMRDPGFRAIWHGHTVQIVDMAWSPDGQRLASASQDGTLRLWAVGQAQSLLTLKDADGATPLSVAWSTRQNGRWGSCTPADGTIRLSNRLQGMPDWVIDYVLVHELAHLLEAGHGPRFWELVGRYPRTERARGYLEGIAAAEHARAE